MKKILVLCTANSCRSQIAEGLIRAILGAKADVCSAGAKPSFVHPRAIQTLAEIGVDIANSRSKSSDEFLQTSFDLVLTVCDNAKEVCPFFPGQPHYLHWSIPDPAGASGSEEEIQAEFRRIREMIAERIIRELVPFAT